jgi:pimeloyl-ACP methyl ester carboxylesterase
MYRVALVLVCSVVAIAAWVATLDRFSSSLQRWFVFPAWKLLSGKARSKESTKLDDIFIYRETYGSGPPVLVLHGGLGSIEDMTHQIMALAKYHLVIAADSRGHGRSSDTDAPLSYATMSDDMLKLLDHLHIEQVSVVGWSDGGIISLDLAIRHPERIKKLVAIGANYDVDGLVESPILKDKIPPVPLRYKLFAHDPNHWPALYRKVVAMQQTQPHYSKQHLNKIEAKTLIMAGEFDVVRRDHTDQLAAAIPNSQEIIVQGAHHSLPIDKPETVNAYILQFLGSCDSKPKQ